MASLSPALLPWIDALALQAAEEFLAGEQAQDGDSVSGSTDPGTLLAFDAAA